MSYRQFKAGFMKQLGSLTAIFMILIIVGGSLGYYIYSKVPETPCAFTSKCETKTISWIKQKWKEGFKDD